MKYFNYTTWIALDGLPTSCIFIFLQRNCRYDGQIAVFGDQFQERLGNLKYFLVRQGHHVYMGEMFYGNKEWECILSCAFLHSSRIWSDRTAHLNWDFYAVNCLCCKCCYRIKLVFQDLSTKWCINCWYLDRNFPDHFVVDPVLVLKLQMVVVYIRFLLAFPSLLSYILGYILDIKHSSDTICLLHFTVTKNITLGFQILLSTLIPKSSSHTGWSRGYRLWDAEMLGHDGSGRWQWWQGGHHGYGHHWEIQPQPTVLVQTVGCAGM